MSNTVRGLEIAVNRDNHEATVASASLIRKGWFSRSLGVRVFRTEYRIEYTTVFGVRLEVHIARTLSAGGWVMANRFLGDFAAPLEGPGSGAHAQLGHIPRINFTLGSVPARLDVRLWPWWTIRGVCLRLGDAVLYAEGCYATADVQVASGPLWDRDVDGPAETGIAADAAQ